MWAIWVKLLLPLALNGCPKCKKLPNLVTLIRSIYFYLQKIVKATLYMDTVDAINDCKVNFKYKFRCGVVHITFVNCDFGNLKF